MVGARCDDRSVGYANDASPQRHHERCHHQMHDAHACGPMSPPRFSSSSVLVCADSTRENNARTHITPYTLPHTHTHTRSAHSETRMLRNVTHLETGPHAADDDDNDIVAAPSMTTTTTTVVTAIPMCWQENSLPPPLRRSIETGRLMVKRLTLSTTLLWSFVRVCVCVFVRV